MNASDSTPKTGGSDAERADLRRITELEAEIDERDDTIRLLNEALSRALDELRLEQAA